MSATVSSSQFPEHTRKRAKITKDTRSELSPNSESTHAPEPVQDIPKDRIIRAQLTNGVKDNSASKVDESRTAIVLPTGEVDDASSKKIIMISSDEESESELSDESDQEEESGTEQNGGNVQAAGGATTDASQLQTPHSSDVILTNGVYTEQSSPHDEDGYQEKGSDAREASEDQDIEVEEEDSAAEEPSFGEQLLAQDSDAIDVDAAFDDVNSPNDLRDHSLTRSRDANALSIPSATSLTTVLTQALRTNDNELLESCFRLNDGDSIRATIDRLQSKLVSQLLQRIAERLYKRPGRAGNLMIWVQWSIVAHGGYLASQPEVVKQLGSLNRVLRERAASLQPLLALKGKLDMLNAQLELRRSKQAAAREVEMDESDEEPVIYVEGEDEEENEINKAEHNKNHRRGRRHRKNEIEDGDVEEIADDDDELIDGANDDGEEDEDSGSDEDVLDLEAEETDADTSDDLENADVDEVEDESGSSSSDGEEEAPSP